MQITWESQQGSQRQANRDAAAVGISGEYLVAVVADAAERFAGKRRLNGANKAAQGLAQYWANSIVSEIVSNGAYNNEASLLTLLNNKHQRLKEHYLHDLASYGLLILNTETNEFQWWFTGDCCLGLSIDGNTIEWLGTLNRLENFPLLGKKAPSNLLTECLKARRYSRPTCIRGKLSAGQSLVIATDGYWCEHLRSGTPLLSLEDDASWLTIKSTIESMIESTPVTTASPAANPEVRAKSDTENLLCIPPLIKINA